MPLPALAALLIAGTTLSACLSLEPLPTVSPSSTPPSASPTSTFTFPTLVPSITPDPTSLPTPTHDALAGLGEVLFLDDFSVNRGWRVGENIYGGTSLVNGRLAIAVRQSETLRLARSPSPDLTDFYVEVDARAEVCRGTDEFGLVFRLSRRGTHYRFALNCEGEARVLRQGFSRTSVIVPRTQSGAAYPATAIDNRLAVWANKNTFRFYINMQEVFRTRDPNLPEGDIGLFVQTARGEQSTVTFDNLVIRAIAPSPPPSQPPTGTEVGHAP